MIFTLLLVTIINLFLWRKIPVFAYLSNVIITLGGIIYFILWGAIIGMHDYYFTGLLILFAGTMIPFFWFIKSSYPRIFNGYILKIFFTLFLAFNFLYCLSVVKLKTLASEGDFVLVRNKDFISRMTWTNWDVSSNFKRFEKMKPYKKRFMLSASCNTPINASWETIKYFRDAWLEYKNL